MVRFTVDDLDAVETCINIAFSEMMLIFKSREKRACICVCKQLWKKLTFHRLDYHIRRTSKKQLQEIMEAGGAEMWGYRASNGDVIATIMIKDENLTTGSVQLLSILPEYMGLGLSSGLLRTSEALLYFAGKSVTKMHILVHRKFKLSICEKLGYTVLAEEQWTELKDVLKDDTYNDWRMVTLGKNL